MRNSVKEQREQDSQPRHSSPPCLESALFGNRKARAGPKVPAQQLSDGTRAGGVPQAQEGGPGGPHVNLSLELLPFEYLMSWLAHTV